MSIAVQLQNAVDRAFNSLSDLVYDGFLIPKKQGGYDWSTSEVTGSSGSRKPIKVIFYQESRSIERGDASTGGTNAINYKAIVKASEFDNRLYDRIEVQGDSYEIDSFDDYLVVTELVLKRVSR
jgi:hypothetical protein